jgi:hypothetical protein
LTRLELITGEPGNDGDDPRRLPRTHNRVYSNQDIKANQIVAAPLRNGHRSELR